MMHMFPVHLSTHWEKWERGQDPEGKTFGWLILVVNGLAFLRVPMPYWPLEHLEPNAGDMTRALTDVLGEAIGGPIRRRD